MKAITEAQKLYIDKFRSDMDARELSKGAGMTIKAVEKYLVENPVATTKKKTMFATTSRTAVMTPEQSFADDKDPKTSSLPPRVLECMNVLRPGEPIF